MGAVSVGMRIALGTIATFNGFLCLVAGGICIAFVQWDAGLVGAGIFWLGSAALFGIARTLREGTGC